jgi:hypothetical protein
MYWRYLNEITIHVCNICSYIKSCRSEITGASVATKAEAKESLPEQEIVTSVMKQ